jgi:hypothetical protein
MRWNTVWSGRFTRTLVCGTIVLSLALSACTQRIAGEPSPAPGFDAASTSSPGQSGGLSNQPQAPNSTASSTDGTASSGRSDRADGDVGGVGSGPGGAPWDPCRIITWEDLPEEKPTDPARAEPQPQAPDPGDAFTAACAFHGVINDIGVLWGPSTQATVAPSGRQGEEQTTVAGRPGLTIVSMTEALTLVCMAKVDLGNDRGVAGVGALALTKDPAPAQHPCAVALRLAAELVKRTP